MGFTDFFKKKNEPKKVTKILTDQYRSSAPTLTSNELQNFYNEVSYLNLMVRKVAEGVGGVKWRLYRTIGDKKKRIEKHPLLELLNQFNPLTNAGMDSWYTIQTWLEINGNGYLMIERDKEGDPAYLWVIKPNDVLELPSKTNNFVYIVKLKNSIQKVPITEIIHFKNVNPNDIYGKGIGTIHSMLDVLQTNKYSGKQVVNYFYNQAVPPYIIGADVTPDQLGELKQSWELNNQGFWNRHKPYFTNSNNINVTKLVDSFNDMQMIQILEYGAETIRQLFGIPPEIIGKVTNSNRATIQGAREIFAREVLLYRLEKINQTLNNTLVLEYGSNLTLEFESPIPSDKEFILRVMQEFRSEFRVNEVRELVGYEPNYEKGDDYIESEGKEKTLEMDKMPINRSDNPKSDKDIRRENEK